MPARSHLADLVLAHLINGALDRAHAAVEELIRTFPHVDGYVWYPVYSIDGIESDAIVDEIPGVEVMLGSMDRWPDSTDIEFGVNTSRAEILRELGELVREMDSRAAGPAEEAAPGGDAGDSTLT